MKIDTDVVGEHILHIHNNLTGKRGKPHDISEIDVYAQNGGVKPDNLAQLQANGGQKLDGVGKDGIFINVIPTTVASKTVISYIVVYILKKTKKIVAQSGVITAVVK
ncbi:MAG: hypothetical protein ACYDCN_08240 [Bacteroidia bacterium]